MSVTYFYASRIHDLKQCSEESNRPNLSDVKACGLLPSKYQSGRRSPGRTTSVSAWATITDRAVPRGSHQVDQKQKPTEKKLGSLKQNTNGAPVINTVTRGEL